MDNWAEEVWPNLTVRYKVVSELHGSKTPFQNMKFVETAHYGRMLLLDNMVQTTERDEFVYHEMLTHVPLCSHPDPRKVLIIGGGDGGILRETLRHEGVEKAVMVEIDQGVIDFSREHLPTINAGSFDSPRAEIVVDDGAAYVKRSGEKFDIVIVDSSDPIGPATVLFSQEFYGDIKRVMNPGGIMVRQTGSSFMQPRELAETLKLLSGLYRHNAGYCFAVPTYIGGFFTASFSSDGVEPLAACDLEALEKRFSPLEKTCKYYTPGVHFGAFQLPGYIRQTFA